MRRWFGRGREPTDDDAAPGPAAPAELREALGALVRRVNSSSGHLPTAAVPEIRDIADRLGELLDHEERVPATDRGGTYETVTLAAVVHDYLPTSIDSYLALPPAFRASHRNAQGETPDEELLGQLELMAKGVDELALAIYSGDAQRLSVQGRFLDTRFSASELTLPEERPGDPDPGRRPGAG